MHDDQDEYLKERLSGRSIALIVLHEIYGINEFIEMTCLQYQRKGFDVFCPDLLGRKNFPYSAAPEAYAFFMDRVRLEVDDKIRGLVSRLKTEYEMVFLLGFSVGAAIAWRCCENPGISGIIGCYGSRIRDHLELQPACPVLLIFADHDAFDVARVVSRLHRKGNTEVRVLKGEHGFLDPFGRHYESEQAIAVNASIQRFLNRCI